MAVGSFTRETLRFDVTDGDDEVEGNVTRRRAGQDSAAADLIGGDSSESSELRVRPGFVCGLLKEVFVSDCSSPLVEELLAVGWLVVEGGLGVATMAVLA